MSDGEHKTNSTSHGPGVMARLARTPMLDLLRGRISGRMDARQQTSQAQLPAELAELVHRAAHGTRLRHREQHEIAQELISHLQDGLAAGEPPEQLRERFGNPATAARLLRWSHLRRRSPPRRLMRRGVQIAAGLLLLLVAAIVFLIVRHTTSRPTISHDYLADLNRPEQEVPSVDRAWPLYRAALMKLEPFPVSDAELNEQAYLHDWPAISAYLKRNRAAFDLARQAADKPRLGFRYGDPDDAAWLKSLSVIPTAPDPKEQSLYTLPTPHLDELARLRRLLLADSRRAEAAGEAEVFLSNLDTLLGMASHLRDGRPVMMTELRAFACFGTLLQLLGRTLIEKPSLLSDEALVNLAHRIATYSGGGTLRARLDGEHLMFEDLLQRMYTDNGAGDGYLTPEGSEFFRQIDFQNMPGNQPPPETWGPLALPIKGTALSLLTASRRDASYMAERLLLRFQAERAGPLWQWEESTAEAQVEALRSSPYLRICYWPVLYMFPAFKHVAMQGEALSQQRDATLTAIALELYRRRHNAWPQSLAELTPSPLPTLPIDRFTGQPLCYRLIDGQPIVYSTGVDRDDDGGRAHRMGNDLAQRWEPWKKVSRPPRLVNDGFGRQMWLPAGFDWDWILWPAPDYQPQRAADADAEL